MKSTIYRDGEKYRVYVDGITLVTDNRKKAERVLQFILKLLDNQDAND